MTRKLIALSLLSVATLAAKNEMRAGVGRIDITPDGPIYMSGYGSRTHPSTGVLQHLWAKALAIEDAKKNQIVIVTTDLIGLPRSITDVVAAKLQKRYGLDRSRILFNSSHTHTGPLIFNNLMTMFELKPDELSKVEEYSRVLSDKLESVAAAAIGDLAPATLDYGFGETGFAMNRRQATPNGVKIGVNPGGPMDKSVPVIRVRAKDGALRAVLFAYACHNTTLTGEFYEISGDYAGFAQAEFERAHPGATALFMLLCAGDQNPEPRSTLDLAQKHGAALAQEVDRVIAGTMARVEGPFRAAFKVTELAFAPHTRETFEKELTAKNAAAARRAKLMMQAYDERRPVRTTPYPVQAIRLNRDLVLLALGGEVVVDYDLRAKKEFASMGKLIVAGYSNDVMCYIPSRRVLEEGGYEAVDSMIYYGKPGPFAPDVEERIFATIRQTLKRI